ncbi:class II fructose-1,6-bisphosphate aldolase [Cellulosilyticum sp. I15G10I2]|uniref:class II fructose-1,6-bisphosphate aldolase n=1 Tax=Cellulosilyticum sp. I15G10I2 TaxID=1892843 RepID=UPI00085C69F3|nr:class II fructose-1,6-bisphosphate aldolase [Cellulosilyticum sp. I15G10I2]
MPLVTAEKMLYDAQKGGYAVGAFNVENMEMIIAAVEAAEELRAPIMLQTTSSTVRYASVKQFYANARAMAEQVSVPVAIHLDHGDSFELAMQALREGYTSIMIDGSHYDFEKNIEITKRVVDAAKPNAIPVEAELGKVGGKEDDLEVKDAGYTDPVEAKEFVERTGITSLAVAIGTAHGFYEGTPKLDIERLKEIKKYVDIPLVLHGASGLSDEDVIKCIKEGICKVNFATELRVAFSDGVKAVLKQNPDVYDPKAYLKVARENVKQLVKNRMIVCGCQGKY